MKIMWFALFSIVAAMVSVAEAQNGRIEATVHVHGDNGEPLPGAIVRLAFEQNGTAEKRVVETATTDDEGRVELAGETSGYVSGMVTNTGCYSVWFATNVHPFEQDSVALTVTVKAVVEPVAMYARRIEKPFPAISTPVGFDLMSADWVAPYGLGQEADFTMEFRGDFAGWSDRREEIILAFPGSRDGVQGFVAPPSSLSTLLSSHVAPADGYTNYWSKMRVHTPSERSVVPRSGPDQHYYFRIRSDDADEGSGLFGKIYGDIEAGFSGETQAVVIFTYYLNPTGSRNLEFDPKQNLFTNLTAMEEVRLP